MLQECTEQRRGAFGTKGAVSPRTKARNRTLRAGGWSMYDALFVILTVGFAAICILYVFGCERL